VLDVTEGIRKALGQGALQRTLCVGGALERSGAGVGAPERA